MTADAKVMTREFLEHATSNPRQYDSTCRSMAAEILALRARAEAAEMERDEAVAQREALLAPDGPVEQRDYAVGMVDKLRAERDAMEKSLRNVRALAARDRGKRIDRETADHLLRFCEEAGIVSSILRAALSSGEGEGGG
jgi:hypothetical protein